jgi:hypothetical protein
MSEKHTPGPWVIEQNGPAFDLLTADHADHFAIIVGMTSNGTGELEANARLIAAAPDLLAACKAAKRYMVQGESGPDGFTVVFPHDDKSLSLLSEAITKAEA